MYAEEADLCLRARKMIGARPRITPEAEIIHYNGASQKVKTDKMVQLLRAKRKLIGRHFPRLATADGHSPVRSGTCIAQSGAGSCSAI